jgi:hypothetical protein
LTVERLNDTTNPHGLCRLRLRLRLQLGVRGKRERDGREGFDDRDLHGALRRLGASIYRAR